MSWGIAELNWSIIENSQTNKEIFQIYKEPKLQALDTNSWSSPIRDIKPRVDQQIGQPMSHLLRDDVLPKWIGNMQFITAKENKYA